MFVYRLTLIDRPHYRQVRDGFQGNWFYYRKIVGGEIINTPLVSSVGLKGLYFYNTRL